MIIELHRNLNEPKRVTCNRAIVRDRHGAPLAIVLEQTPGLVTMIQRDDPEFHTLLAILHIEDN